MGICCLEQNYMFLRNNVYRNKTVQLAWSVTSRENVVIHEHCKVAEKSELINSVVGRNCKIGRCCVLQNAFVFNNVEIGDKCILKNCVIGSGTIIGDGSMICDGAVIDDGCVIPKGSNIDKQFIVAKATNDDFDDGEFIYEISILFMYSKSNCYCSGLLIQQLTQKWATKHT